MSKRFHFSARVTTAGAILILTMLCLSHWQWNRHLEKKKLIAALENRLALPATTPAESWSALLDNPSEYYFRKLLVQGTFDYEREIVIKNRRYENTPGMLVVTPLKISGSDTRVLVNRGFVPLSMIDDATREKFRAPATESFIALIKEPAKKKLFAPADPPVSTDPWQREFLRIDIDYLAQQFPYPIAPFYVERMAEASNQEIQQSIVTSSSNKEEMLLLPLRAINQESERPNSLAEYPIPFFTTVIPPGRHLGYVFEWAAMAGMTFLICLVLQLRRPRKPAPSAIGPE